MTRSPSPNNRRGSSGRRVRGCGFMRPLPAAIALMIAPSLAATAHQAAAAKPVAPPCAILVARLGDAGDQLGSRRTSSHASSTDGRNACLAAWASSLERATTTACRTAVESGAAPEVLDALRRLVASPVKQAVFQEGATDPAACSALRPAWCPRSLRSGTRAPAPAKRSAAERLPGCAARGAERVAEPHPGRLLFVEWPGR